MSGKVKALRQCNKDELSLLENAYRYALVPSRGQDSISGMLKRNRRDSKEQQKRLNLKEDVAPSRVGQKPSIYLDSERVGAE